MGLERLFEAMAKLADLRAALGDARFAAVWAEGQAIDWRAFADSA